jgi:hypothetical protein
MDQVLEMVEMVAQALSYSVTQILEPSALVPD